MLNKFVLGAAFCLAAGACLAASVDVGQQNLAFDKSDLTVSKGDTVTFSNNDKTAHNILVTGEGLSINGGLQQPGQSFTAPFIKEGTFQVTCAIHPNMKLTVHVK